MNRLSIVGRIKIIAIGTGSTLLVGDNLLTTPKTKILAVRRDIPTFRGDEGSFALYPFFRRPIPRLAEDQTVTMLKKDQGAISVGNIDVSLIGLSSVFQVGTTGDIIADTRVKQFRQLLSLTSRESPG